MNATSVVTLILSAALDFGSAMLTILGAALLIGLGYLVFRFGWSKLGGDMSLEIGGFYPLNTPFKGYHRFRSKSWNMAHMP